ncbi:tetratricopeptide repeat protein [Nafulsella turpanensis]|uniref:tetratricopeptide repeat protein n=1 Tax=Nafulsella turpanensis TaxID=1265690 RepID=UPI00126788FF|nr:tetratricopeptide repeat protein [Nafulsella turpanensis]
MLAPVFEQPRENGTIFNDGGFRGIFVKPVIYLWFLTGTGDPLIFGAATYLGVSFMLRTLVPSDHRKGMSLIRKEKYNEAINYFEKSYSFFKQNDWVDKYRYLTLLSSTRLSYKEMALNNIAFCYGQVGDGGKAREYYEKTLNEFPESGIAKAGLRLLNAASNI